MAKILDLQIPYHFPITRGFFLDYAPSKNCCNDKSYGEVCVKCGKCGRKFIDGVLQKGGAE